MNEGCARDTMNLQKVYFQSISINETLHGQRALRSFSFTHQETSSSLDGRCHGFLDTTTTFTLDLEAILSHRRQRRVTCSQSRINDKSSKFVFYILLFHDSHESHDDRARKVIQLTKMYPNFHGILCLAGLLVVPRPRTSAKAALGKNKRHGTLTVRRAWSRSLFPGLKDIPSATPSNTSGREELMLAVTLTSWS